MAPEPTRVGYKDLAVGRALHGQGRILPSTLMLASKVVFLPWLRGIEQRALYPLGAQAYKGESAVLVPFRLRKRAVWYRALMRLSPARSPSDTRPVLALLRFFFRLKPTRFKSLRTVESLRRLLVRHSKKRRLSAIVAAGRSLKYPLGEASKAPH